MLFLYIFFTIIVLYLDLYTLHGVASYTYH